jgi:hypothetical protein
MNYNRASANLAAYGRSPEIGLRSDQLDLISVCTRRRPRSASSPRRSARARCARAPSPPTRPSWPRAARRRRRGGCSRARGQRARRAVCRRGRAGGGGCMHRPQAGMHQLQESGRCEMARTCSFGAGCQSGAVRDCGGARAACCVTCIVACTLAPLCAWVREYRGAKPGLAGYGRWRLVWV